MVLKVGHSYRTHMKESEDKDGKIFKFMVDAKDDIRISYMNVNFPMSPTEEEPADNNYKSFNTYIGFSEKESESFDKFRLSYTLKKSDKNFKTDKMYYLIVKADWEEIRKGGVVPNYYSNDLEFDFSILVSQKDSLIHLLDGVP